MLHVNVTNMLLEQACLRQKILVCWGGGGGVGGCSVQKPRFFFALINEKNIYKKYYSVLFSVEPSQMQPFYGFTVLKGATR